MHEKHDLLQQNLTETASHARAQLQRAAGQRAVRRSIGKAMLLLLVGPAVLLLIEGVRYAAGAEAGLGLVGWLCGLTVVIPGVYLLSQFFTRRPSVDRAGALAAMDKQLATGDRLLTADSFMQRAARTGFEEAAIEDAIEVSQRAAHESVRVEPSAIRVGWFEKLAVPVAVVLLLAGLWVSTLAVIRADEPSGEQVALQSDAIRSPSIAPQDEIDLPEQSPPPPATQPPPELPRQDQRAGARTTAAPSKDIPDNAEEASGAMGSGQASESEQASSPSNARGAPSSQGQPSKPGEQSSKKPKKPKRRSADNKQEQQPDTKSTDPAGSTAGQGSSRGSNKNPAVSDWSSRDQINTPDDNQVDEHDEVEDEEEEQESRGGVQPNLRDRRPPVNRDLRIGFGNQKNPDANGRGGPSAQKKSRGVASLVLGAPIADRVKGQPNPGKTKVTQQRIQPEFEAAEPTDAQARPARSGQVGAVFRADMSPWLRAVVRRYFLQNRPAIEANTSEADTEPATQP